MTVGYLIDIARPALSVRQTADWLKRTMAEMPAVIARRDNKVVGYTVTTTLAESAHAAIVEVMLRSFAAPPQCYLYGSAYVAESNGIARPACHDICGSR
jgi:hypothetical protein